jgi:hypothetical protein
MKANTRWNFSNKLSFGLRRVDVPVFGQSAAEQITEFKRRPSRRWPTVSPVHLMGSTRCATRRVPPVRTRKLIIVSGIVLAGCASASGVVPVGQDTFMVSRQAATGLSGMGSLKADAFQEANQYCETRGKLLQVVHTSESAPPYLLGNFPRVELQFMCLASNDAQLKRPVLSPPQ